MKLQGSYMLEPKTEVLKNNGRLRHAMGGNIINWNVKHSRNMINTWHVMLTRYQPPVDASSAATNAHSSTPL
eukprot:12936412-Prorocentrum_lima.AAC.1